MELDRAAIRDEEEAASEVTEDPVPQAPTLHDRVEVAAGVVPPEARPLGRSVAAEAVVAGLTRVRAVEAEAALAVVAVVCHRVVVEEGAAADINRSSPQAL